VGNNGSTFIPGRTDPAVCLFQFLRENTRLGQGGHKIGVPTPAWHNMQMHMTGNPGSGGFTDIGTKIEGGGPVNLAENGHTLGCQFDHFGAYLHIQYLEGGEVCICYHH
jgi:hypothetical protein